jgi:hypothetical protein
MANDRADIYWAPRVSLALIRRLYVAEARGLCDEAQLDEVGVALYLRCQSILEYTRALEGTVQCKRCARSGVVTLIERATREPAELLRCPVCGWQVRWRVYVAEANKVRGQLAAGHAGPAFQRYVEAYPHCRNARDKMLAIDQLIHDFHWVLRDEDQAPEAWKPAGVNLLQGSTTQVLELLDELAYGDHPPPELLAQRERWRAVKSVIRRLGPRDEER